MLGMKNIGFAAVTNPATGLVSGWTHDGEGNLIAARKCLEGLTKTIYKIIEKFEFSEKRELNTGVEDTIGLSMKRIDHGFQT